MCNYHLNCIICLTTCTKSDTHLHLIKFVKEQVLRLIRGRSWQADHSHGISDILSLQSQPWFHHIQGGGLGPQPSQLQG